MKLIDDDDMKKIPNDVDVIWVCGSHMPAANHPMRENAVKGECQHCRSEIVYNKTAPANAVKVCLRCAHIMHKAYADSGEEPEVVMRSKDKETFLAGSNPENFERLASLATDLLKNGPKRR